MSSQPDILRSTWPTGIHPDLYSREGLVEFVSGTSLALVGMGMDTEKGGQEN